jgi:hypothetical protein
MYVSYETYSTFQHQFQKDGHLTNYEQEQKLMWINLWQRENSILPSKVLKGLQLPMQIYRSN